MKRHHESHIIMTFNHTPLAVSDLSAGDMEDLGMEPSKFFCQLGLLIIESRVPELSTRGRTEGPHCPADVGHMPCPKHDCDWRNSRVSTG